MDAVFAIDFSGRKPRPLINTLIALVKIMSI